MSFSGKFVVRVGENLHRRLSLEAKQNSLSLNQLCLSYLSSSYLAPQFRDVLAKVQEIYGTNLVGVLIYGSWARGEASTNSDVDLLLAFKSGTTVRRSMYRLWDEGPSPVIDNLPVQVTLASIPSRDEIVSGFWAELACDGIVLWDPSFMLNRHLLAVREHIATGSIVRQTSHGQRYWISNQKKGGVA